MTTILAIIGSARPWGNCEILAREALAGARDAGANTLALVRLTDLHVEQCTGCMDSPAILRRRLNPTMRTSHAR